MRKATKNDKHLSKHISLFFSLEVCTIYLVVEAKCYCCRINNVTILCPMFLAWNSLNPKMPGLPYVLTWRERSLVCLSLPIGTWALLNQSLILMPSFNLYCPLLGSIQIQRLQKAGVALLIYNIIFSANKITMDIKGYDMMISNGNSLTLIVGMYNGADNMEKSLEVSY